MKRILLSTLLLFGISGWQAHAAELSPDNIIGHYKVTANAGFRRVNLKIHVLNTNEFEIQRVYASGRGDEVCNGTYRLDSQLAWNIANIMTKNVFKGVFTCPSNRQRKIDFNIDYKNRTTEDLIKGTTVTVTTSLAPGYSIKAFVIKQ